MKVRLLFIAIAATPVWASTPETGPPSPTPVSMRGSGTLVPLALWTSKTSPDGLSFGATRGISWGDFDADGWPDVFVFQSGELWHNDGGTGWSLALDVDDMLPQDFIRYGASFADYNEDGLPDLAIEPRIDNFDSCFRLLENRGSGPDGPVFVDVSEDPFVVVDRPCGLEAETACWADVNGDGTIDLFLPVYAPWEPVQPSLGNRFFLNTGPVGKLGSYQLVEMVDDVGLANVSASDRPEGAQFFDFDGDGDVDVYCAGLVYRNRSTVRQPSFLPLSQIATGIGLPGCLDEGASFLDYDMDGDFDLAVVYECIDEARIWESRGDGTFFAANNIIQTPEFPEGSPTGLSVADWDNDGDPDLTTDSRFRRNMLMEDGVARFVLAAHEIDDTHITKATPAWADWDHDGDLDCAMGNYGGDGYFYENTTYIPETPETMRRYVRVRPLRDGGVHGEGTETEFGAITEVTIAGETPRRRRQFTSSSGGYLNQNQYTSQFALPSPRIGELVFDVSVDFPSLPLQGRVRVDKSVNPVLGLIDLLTLPPDREIEVFRSGRVRIGGVDFDAVQSPQMLVTAGGLRESNDLSPLANPAAAPAGTFVGLETRVGADAFRVRIREIILDGQLAPPVECDGELHNIAIWDVTVPLAPNRVATLAATTSPRNDRTHLQTSLLLLGGRTYRIVARMASTRNTPITAPIANGAVTTNGGLSFVNAGPCPGLGVATAPLLANQINLAVSFSEETLTTSCPDFNVDGIVNEIDIVVIILAWGSTFPGDPADLNGDGEVDIDDLIIVITGWGPCS